MYFGALQEFKIIVPKSSFEPNRCVNNNKKKKLREIGIDIDKLNKT